jgi:hypothetical protein
VIVTRLKIPLTQDELFALAMLAELELRGPVDEARFIIRKELERRGLLSTQGPMKFTEIKSGDDQDHDKEGN